MDCISRYFPVLNSSDCAYTEKTAATVTAADINVFLKMPVNIIFIFNYSDKNNHFV